MNPAAPVKFANRQQLAGTFGMVASTHWLASAAGMAVLESGGNAFDAAAATGFVLVVEPLIPIITLIGLSLPVTISGAVITESVFNYPGMGLLIWNAALSPRLIVADEPVSALDVSIQSQVLNLMKGLQADLGLTYIVISHDLSVVRYLADRIGVMYLGKLVEIGPAAEIYARPAHPYTASLLEAVPVPDPQQERAKKSAVIKGELPSALNPPSGCRFRTRCPRAADRCAEEEPLPRPFGDGHLAACHFPLEPALTASSLPPASPAGGPSPSIPAQPASDQAGDVEVG